MKKQIQSIYGILLMAVLTILSNTLIAQVNVTATGGSSTGSYGTLKLAFDAINVGTHAGIISITITANTTETATAVLDSSGSGSSIYSSVSINPFASGSYTITGSVAGDLIRFNGADFVSITGLTFENTAIGASSTFKFINDASHNNVTNCVIKGASTTITTGSVVFATGVFTGNDSNVVTNCTVDSSSLGYPANAIYSGGTVGAENSNNTISFNKICNFFSPTLATGGIVISTGSTGWNILDNKIYQSANRLFTTANNHRAIGIITGTNYVISNNKIGFADSNSTGFYTMSGAVASTFAGIILTAAVTGSSTISSNIISNFDFTTAATTSTLNGAFAGITVTTGSAIISQNTIGAISGTAAIKVTPGSGGTIMGINSSSANNITMVNNYFGAIQNIGPTAATIASIHCINISGSAATLTMRNNTIGNPSPDNIVAGILGTTTANTLVSGIWQPSTAITIIACSNTIRNLSSFGSGAGAYVRGYHTSLSTTATSTAKVDSNTVYNLKTNGAFVGVASGALAVNGIHYLANLAGGSMSYNLIYNLSSLNTGTGAYHVGGIAIGSATNTVISNNTIYDLKNEGTSITATAPAVIAGIVLRSATTVVKVINNFVSLGNGVSGNVAVIGIYANHGSTPNPIDSVLFNTVHLEGTGTGAQPSFAFYRGDFSATARLAPVALYGNIFQNTRTGGTAKHYAISNGYGTTASVTGWGAGASNNNDLYSATSTTIGSWGNTDYTFSTWKTISAGDASSVNKIVSFVNTATADLHLGLVSQGDPDLTVTSVYVVPVDYDGQIRGILQTQMGGDEYITPVPVKLVFFKAKASGEDALLQWQTVAESDNSHFEIQRSADNRNFEPIASVKGNGTTNGVINYSYTDYGTGFGNTKMYYRLSQVDFDGTSNLSNTEIVVFNGAAALETISALPNPFSEMISLKIESYENTELVIEITDIQGRLITRSNQSVKEGTNILPLTATQELERGIYFVKSILNGESKVIKVLKN